MKHVYYKFLQVDSFPNKFHNELCILQIRREPSINHMQQAQQTENAQNPHI